MSNSPPVDDKQKDTPPKDKMAQQMNQTQFGQYSNLYTLPTPPHILNMPTFAALNANNATIPPPNRVS
jgi:hypothetical protein